MLVLIVIAAAGMLQGSASRAPELPALADWASRRLDRMLPDDSSRAPDPRLLYAALLVVPAALPGVAGAMLLAVSRAIGETMIVVMAAGLAANLTANPFEAVTTVTVQIVTLLTGDQEFNSPKTLSAFGLGLTLFLVTLLLTPVARHVAPPRVTPDRSARAARQLQSC